MKAVIPREVADGLATRDAVLAQLAVAAVAGLPPASPTERKHEPVAFATHDYPESMVSWWFKAAASTSTLKPTLVPWM